MYTVRLCFLLLWQCHQFWMDSYELFIHILQGCCTGTGQSYDWLSAIELTLKDMGQIDCFHTTTKHIKAWTMCKILDVLYILDRAPSSTMYRLWLHGLYGLYGPCCPLRKTVKLNHSLHLLHSYARNLVIQINVHEPSFQLYLYAISRP